MAIALCSITFTLLFHKPSKPKIKDLRFANSTKYSPFNVLLKNCAFLVRREPCIVCRHPSQKQKTFTIPPTQKPPPNCKSYGHMTWKRIERMKERPFKMCQRWLRCLFSRNCYHYHGSVFQLESVEFRPVNIIFQAPKAKGTKRTTSGGFWRFFGPTPSSREREFSSLEFGSQVCCVQASTMENTKGAGTLTACTMTIVEFGGGGIGIEKTGRFESSL